jgi:hypothetical protein
MMTSDALRAYRLGLVALTLLATTTGCFPRMHFSPESAAAANHPVRVRLRAEEGVTGHVSVDQLVGHYQDTTVRSDRLGGLQQIDILVPVFRELAPCLLPAECVLPQEVSHATSVAWFEDTDGWRAELRADRPLIAGREYVVEPMPAWHRVLITLGASLAAVALGVGLLAWGLNEEGPLETTLTSVGGTMIVGGVATMWFGPFFIDSYARLREVL